MREASSSNMLNESFLFRDSSKLENPCWLLSSLDKNSAVPLSWMLELVDGKEKKGVTLQKIKTLFFFDFVTSVTISTVLWTLSFSRTRMNFCSTFGKTLCRWLDVIYRMWLSSTISLTNSVRSKGQVAELKIIWTPSRNKWASLV